MPTLRERTRRLITSALFVLLGPVALCAATLALYWETTPRAAMIIGERLSRHSLRSIALKRRERLQPGVERLVDVEIKSRASGVSLLYCPEIYKLRISDADILRKFALSFDNCGVKKIDEEASDNSAGQNAANDHFCSASKAEATNTLLKNGADPESFSVLIIPRIVYCSSPERDKADAFEIGLLDALSYFDKDSKSFIGVVSDEILLSDREEYNSIRLKKTTTKALSKKKLLAIFNASVFQTPRGNANLDEQTTQREIIAFASEAPRVNKFRALRVNATSFVRVDALFELEKISSPTPVYASLTFDRLRNSSRFEYDSSGGPTPGSLASKIIPPLDFLQQQGWLTGRIVVDAKKKGTNFSWSARLHNFHLRCFGLEELCRRFDLPPCTGSVVDLSIEEGQIYGGVFCGSGRIKVNEGAIPVDVVRRLVSIDLLTTAPKQATQWRFVNDVIPFNELELQFLCAEDGISFDSQYRNKIVAYYEKGSVKYGLFLPRRSAGQKTPYAETLTALFDSEGEASFWNPLVRNAINHLPVPAAVSGGDDKRMLR